MTKKELWILSEWQVTCHRIRHFNEELIAHRERIGGVEVDLLLRSRSAPGNWALIEVKSRPDDLWEYGPAVSFKQKRRYLRVNSILRDQLGGHVESLIAVVGHKNGRFLDPEVRYFDLEESLY